MSFEDQDPDVTEDANALEEAELALAESQAVEEEVRARAQERVNELAELEKQKRKTFLNKMATNRDVIISMQEYHDAVVKPLQTEVKALQMRVSILEREARKHGW